MNLDLLRFNLRYILNRFTCLYLVLVLLYFVLELLVFILELLVFILKLIVFCLKRCDVENKMVLDLDDYRVTILSQPVRVHSHRLCHSRSKFIQNGIKFGRPSRAKSDHYTPCGRPPIDRPSGLAAGLGMRISFFGMDQG
jgi:hypothetical protein